MLENFNALTLIAMSELNQLRTQAIDLFDRCLAEGNTIPIVTFIERQVVDEPPQLQLLHDIAEDLQQRLLSLRSYHYDVRKNVVKTFAEAYGVDITTIVPASDLDRYHLTDAKGVLAYVQAQGTAFTDRDLILLGKLLEASIKMAARLTNDIKLTSELLEMVMDWLDALSMTVGRRFWSEESSTHPPTIH
jgi:hypothetical protein